MALRDHVGTILTTVVAGAVASLIGLAIGVGVNGQVLSEHARRIEQADESQREIKKAVNRLTVLIARAVPDIDVQALDFLSSLDPETLNQVAAVVSETARQSVSPAALAQAGLPNDQAVALASALEGRQRQRENHPSDSQDIPAVAMINIPDSNPRVIGPKDAKVTVVQFTDYECPFCQRTDGVVSDVLEQQPAGVRFVFKSFPLVGLHPHAELAARAAVAAGKQGKFWEMHQLLFDAKGDLSIERLRGLAREIGLDVVQWERDVESEEVRATVKADLQQAAAAEVKGAPTIFVNGRRLSPSEYGTPDGLRETINRELARGEG